MGFCGDIVDAVVLLKVPLKIQVQTTSPPCSGTGLQLIHLKLISFFQAARSPRRGELLENRGPWRKKPATCDNPSYPNDPKAKGYVHRIREPLPHYAHGRPIPEFCVQSEVAIGLWCYFSGGGPAGLADGAHRPAKARLSSPTYTIKHNCLHSAGAASGKPWPYLHVDGDYCAPTSSTMTSSGRYQHAEFLGLKEAAVATIFSGLGGTAVTMLAHVPLYMQFDRLLCRDGHDDRKR
ncbi:hypothetical protein HPB50_024581 [Hyalomma asiaticum]|uniref:Uncharacterized protein n=1 Tax=Hyalomma asiaticum TaxID=266040 RepID=A0ACB7SZE0_HYAAI|nr:hypothetical protein HPB50_024581 [Hyalomma asiaticum]